MAPHPKPRTGATRKERRSARAILACQFGIGSTLEFSYVSQIGVTLPDPNAEWPDSGADLEVFDIMRARDHGVWNYNELRAGFGLARQRGIDAAKFELICMVDDDNWLAPDWLETVALVEKLAPKVIVAGHRRPDGDDHAVAIANNSIFGLSGSVFGTDTEREMDFLLELRRDAKSVVPMFRMRNRTIGTAMNA